MTFVRMSVVLGIVASSVAALAQAPPAQPGQAVAAVEAAASRASVSLRIQVVLSRYQGEKKISSFPYTFSVTADRSRAELRMGSQIPLSAVVNGTATTSYKDVGTQINCSATPAGGESFKLDMSISDSSLYDDGPQAPARPGGLQSIRSFYSSNTLTLRDGQSSQFTTATDRITGEVTKADVTLTVVK